MILLAFQDITERKEAEVAKVRLAAIVESSMMLLSVKI